MSLVVDATERQTTSALLLELVDKSDHDFLDAWRRLVLHKLPKSRRNIGILWEQVSEELPDVALALLNRQRRALMHNIAGSSADFALDLYNASTAGDLRAVRALISRHERNVARSSPSVVVTDAITGAACAGAPIFEVLVDRASKICRAMTVAIERGNHTALRAMMYTTMGPCIPPTVLATVVANDAWHDSLRAVLPDICNSVNVFTEFRRAVDHNAVRNTLFLAEQLPPQIINVHWATCRCLLWPPQRVRSGALLALMDLPAVQPGQDMLRHVMRAEPFEPLEALLVATHPRFKDRCPTRRSYDEMLQPFDMELCALDRLIMYAAIDLGAANDSLLLLLMRGPLATHTRFMKRECAKSLERVFLVEDDDDDDDDL